MGPAFEFTLTDQHIKLLRSSCVEWGDGDWGAPCIDSKRPAEHVRVNVGVLGDLDDLDPAHLEEGQRVGIARDEFDPDIGDPVLDEAGSAGKLELQRFLIASG